MTALLGFVMLVASVVLASVSFLRSRSAKAAVDTPTGGRPTMGGGPMGRDDLLTDRVFMGVARPLMDSGRFRRLAETEEMGWLQRMLLAAGSPYGGSVEVFLSMQAAAVVVGLGVAFFLTNVISLGPTWLGALFGLALMFTPFSRLKEQARKRSDQVLQDLPDFVDLLMIPIVAGSGIKRALRETAERFRGPVRTEILNAMGMVDVGKPLSEALWYCGHRLAVPEARVFFSALAQAEQQGTSVREMLERQRDSLRHEAHQRSRAEIKKIPTKIVFVFGLHFMPVLFAIALLPLIAAMAKIS